MRAYMQKKMLFTNGTVYPSHHAIAERTVIPKREFSPSYAETVRSQDMICKIFLFIFMEGWGKKTTIKYCQNYSSQWV